MRASRPRQPSDYGHGVPRRHHRGEDRRRRRRRHRAHRALRLAAHRCDHHRGRRPRPQRFLARRRQRHRAVERLDAVRRRRRVRLRRRDRHRHRQAARARARRRRAAHDLQVCRARQRPRSGRFELASRGFRCARQHRATNRPQIVWKRLGPDAGGNVRTVVASGFTCRWLEGAFTSAVVTTLAADAPSFRSQPRARAPTSRRAWPLLRSQPSHR